MNQSSGGLSLPLVLSFVRLAPFPILSGEPEQRGQLERRHHQQQDRQERQDSGTWTLHRSSIDLWRNVSAEKTIDSSLGALLAGGGDDVKVVSQSAASRVRSAARGK